MGERQQHIQDKHGKDYLVIIRRDRRLKKTSRFQLQPDGKILVRIPYRLPKRYLKDVLHHVEENLDNLTSKDAQRTDGDLQKRAEYINRKYFKGRIHWRAIRWVNNMNTRLGSCTSGGNTDGHIRISSKIAKFPDWVLDYVIAHELAHRVHPNHSKDFWRMLKKAYPRTDEARAFIRGYYFAKGEELEEE